MIPDDFARRTILVHGERGRAWLSDLPTRLAQLAIAWDVELGPPFPDLSYNYVAPARGNEGQPYVIKAGMGGGEGDREPVALRAYNGRGAVRLVRHDIERSAMLLERVEPGDDLRAVPDPQAAEIAADVLRELWTAEIPEELPSLSLWTASLERFGGDPGPLPRDLVDQALDLRKDLLAHPPDRVLVHGDLHHMNVLRANDRGWVAIDPKGVAGEKAYDLASFLFNPGPVPLETTRLRIETFVERLELDRQRVLAWTFVQALVSACWTLEDHETGWESAVRMAEDVKAIGL